MIKASVILCTYNPQAVILNEALEGLKQQSLNTTDWELIIVDNNSTNRFQDDLDLSWHEQSVVITETKQGLTHARIAGILKANSLFLVFVDDDNILDCHYLKNAIQIGNDYSFLGAWGGTSIGEYEIPPPPWFTKKHFEMLAISTIERDVWSNKYFDLATNPIGAGLVIRRDVGLAYVESQKNDRLVLDRSGSSLLSGGDNEMVFKAIDLGYGTGNFTSLVLTHYITAGRLTEDYMIRLTESIAMSNVLLSFKFGRDYDLPVRPRGIATDLLYKFQRLRMNPIKKALIDAEVNGILQGKKILAKYNA